MFGILLLFSVVFASMVPLSCNIYVYPDMQCAYVADPNITDRLACKHAGQILFMNMDVPKQFFSGFTLRATAAFFVA